MKRNHPWATKDEREANEARKKIVDV